MNFLNSTRQIFFLLLLFGAFVSVQAQNVEIKDLANSHVVDIKKETAPDLNWGEAVMGTAVRAKVEFTNNYDKTMKLVKVVGEPGCYPVGNKLALRDVEVKPGEKLDFWVLVRCQELGAHSYKVELILEDEKEKKSRMATFQFHGDVIAARD